MIITIPWNFRHIAWHVWKDMKKYNATEKLDHLDSVRWDNYADLTQAHLNPYRIRWCIGS